ncbi:riboflavin synthase [bacterium]|nr:riboflavin synthase [bacterium]
MFTGLIEGLSQISKISKNRSGLDVHCRYAVPNDTKIGASVCLNGVCSTIVSTSETSFFIQLLSETLEISTFNDIAVGDYLNLEWSLTPSSKMGGHIVSGHVDDVGVIEEISWGEKWGTLVIEFDEKWKNNIVYKGSITIDGISLTIAELGKNWVKCCVIPHTLESTVLKYKKNGDKVNLEFDMLGKYFNRYISNCVEYDNGSSDKNTKFIKKLLNAGFLNEK